MIQVKYKPGRGVSYRGMRVGTNAHNHFHHIVATFGFVLASETTRGRWIGLGQFIDEICRCYDAHSYRIAQVVAFLRSLAIN